MKLNIDRYVRLEIHSFFYLKWSNFGYLGSTVSGGRQRTSSSIWLFSDWLLKENTV